MRFSLLDSGAFIQKSFFVIELRFTSVRYYNVSLISRLPIVLWIFVEKC